MKFSETNSVNDRAHSSTKESHTSCMISIFLIHLNGLHVYCLKIQSFGLRQIDDFKQALHRTFVYLFPRLETRCTERSMAGKIFSRFGTNQTPGISVLG